MLQGCKWLLDPAFQPHLKSTKTFHTKSQAFLSTAKHVLQKELKKHQVLWWWLVVTKGRFGSDDFPFHFFRWKSQVETAFCFLGFFHIFLRFHHLADDIYIYKTWKSSSFPRNIIFQSPPLLLGFFVSREFSLQDEMVQNANNPMVTHGQVGFQWNSWMQHPCLPKTRHCQWKYINLPKKERI